MSYSERIQQMQAQGTLSPAQAQRLKEALAGYESAPVQTTKKPLPTAWIAGGLTLALVVALVFAGGGETAPQQVQQVSEILNQQEGLGAMNKGITSIVSIALLFIVPILIFSTSHNSLVNREEAVLAAWAQVESNYQRRADLIPNLIETVSKFMKHERETLGELVAERGENASLDEVVEQLVKSQENSAAVMKESGGALPEDEAYLAKLTAAQNGVGLGMRKLMAVAENYPSLRSSDQMLELQAQLEGTENRINVARMRFNEAAEEFNAAIRRMPASLIASMGGFKRKAYFKSDEGADNGVNIKFE